MARDACWGLRESEDQEDGPRNVSLWNPERDLEIQRPQGEAWDEIRLSVSPSEQSRGPRGGQLPGAWE